MRKPVAMITGASRGIGRGIALALAEHGFDIAACATSADPNIREKGLFEVIDRVTEFGRRCEPVVGDIGDIDAHRGMVDTALASFGRIDVLVNNAGVAPLQRMDILDCTPESYDRVMGINLRGSFFLSQRVARHMLEQTRLTTTQQPTIVFVSSISAFAASPNRTEYCISKAGMSMAAKSFAVRLAEFGINVFEVQPGITETDMTSAVKEKYDALISEGLLLTPRWGTPEDVGKAVAALCSGYFSYSPGACIEVGGGFGISRL